MNDVVLEAMGSLDVAALEEVRSRLEEVAELAEGVEPMSRVWSRRVDVDVVRLALNVTGHRIEFELDRANETVNVVMVQPVAGERQSSRTAS